MATLGASTQTRQPWVVSQASVRWAGDAVVRCAALVRGIFLGSGANSDASGSRRSAMVLMFTILPTRSTAGLRGARQGQKIRSGANSDRTRNGLRWERTG